MLILDEDKTLTFSIVQEVKQAQQLLQAAYNAFAGAGLGKPTIQQLLSLAINPKRFETLVRERIYNETPELKRLPLRREIILDGIEIPESVDLQAFVNLKQAKSNSPIRYQFEAYDASLFILSGDTILFDEGLLKLEAAKRSGIVLDNPAQEHVHKIASAVVDILNMLSDAHGIEYIVLGPSSLFQFDNITGKCSLNTQILPFIK